MTRVCVRFTCLLLLFVVVSFSRAASAGDRPWLEVKSAHFTVESDAGEKSARDIVWQFEQVSAVLRVIWPWAATDMGKPLLVLAPRDEEGMKALAPQFWEQKNGVRPGSLSVEGLDGNYVALRADALADVGKGEINPYQNAYWSYTSLVLGHGLKHRLPVWLARGISNVMSNTIVRSPSIQIGRVIPWRLQRVRSGGELRLPEMFRVGPMTSWMREADKLSEFDALSWALVHFLMFADDGAHRQYLDRFIALVNQGQSTDAALDFGMGDVAKLEQAFRSYTLRGILPFIQLSVDASVKRESFPARTLSRAEQLSTRAAFFMAERRPVEARASADAARQADPGLAAAYEVDGLIADSDNKRVEARAAFLKAIELGSTNFYVHYRWATLSRGPDADRETIGTIARALQRSTELNGTFAPAYATHGEVAAMLGQTDQALDLVHKAIALEPAQVQPRLSLALVLWKAGRREEAARESRDALALTATDAERRSVQEVIDFFAKAGAPKPHW
jgi:tetratricopeptide (TPR) repeat protein